MFHWTERLNGTITARKMTKMDKTKQKHTNTHTKGKLSQQVSYSQ